MYGLALQEFWLSNALMVGCGTGEVWVVWVLQYKGVLKKNKNMVILELSVFYLGN